MIFPWSSSTRLTRPARLWGTLGRIVRKAAPAPTSSATRVSSSTSRESVSTEPRLPVFSAELVKHFQNKTKDNDNTLPAEGPLAVILDNVPSETSQKPAPLCPVGKSAPQMKVGKTTFPNIISILHPIVLSCSIFAKIYLSSAQSFRKGLQVCLRPGDQGSGRKPSRRLHQTSRWSWDRGTRRGVVLPWEPPGKWFVWINAGFLSHWHLKH